MPSPATEIATIPLSSEANIEDPSSAANKAWRSFIDTVSAQPGFQLLSWGRQVESPNLVDVFIGKYHFDASWCFFSELAWTHVSTSEWDSVQSHTDFIENPIYQGFLKNIGTILDGNITLFHLYFASHPPSSVFGTASAGVAEHLAFYFASTISDAERSSWDKTYADFKKVLEQHAKGFKTSIEGWVIEELQHESVEGAAKAYISVIEWESVDKHVAFRETEEFKKAIGPLRDGSKGIKMHHVKLINE